MRSLLYLAVWRVLCLVVSGYTRLRRTMSKRAGRPSPARLWLGETSGKNSCFLLGMRLFLRIALCDRVCEEKMKMKKKIENFLLHFNFSPRNVFILELNYGKNLKVLKFFPFKFCITKIFFSGKLIKMYFGWEFNKRYLQTEESYNENFLKSVSYIRWIGCFSWTSVNLTNHTRSLVTMTNSHTTRGENTRLYPLRQANGYPVYMMCNIDVWNLMLELFHHYVVQSDIFHQLILMVFVLTKLKMEREGRFVDPAVNAVFLNRKILKNLILRDFIFKSQES